MSDTMEKWRREEAERQARAAENVRRFRNVLDSYGVTKVYITYDGGGDECHATLMLDSDYLTNEALVHQMREELGLVENDWTTDPFNKLGWELGQHRAREVEYSLSGSGHFWSDLATGKEIPDTHHGSRSYEEEF